jgi:hypothetical protein
MNRSILIRTGAVAFTAMALLGVAGPALANDADVIRRGGCSGSSDWKLKASPQNGRIEVEGEVDSNVSGQTWKWKMLHNGEVSARGSATTGARSGSFDVRRLMVNVKGDDHIGWRAKNPNSGEVCRGSLTF